MQKNCDQKKKIRVFPFSLKKWQIRKKNTNFSVDQEFSKSRENFWFLLVVFVNCFSKPQKTTSRASLYSMSVMRSITVR